MTKNSFKQTVLLEELAHFLVDDAVAKSIMLQVEEKRGPNSPLPKFAKEWAKLYQASGLHGYPTYEETVMHLNRLFFSDK